MDSTLTDKDRISKESKTFLKNSQVINKTEQRPSNHMGIISNRISAYYSALSDDGESVVIIADNVSLTVRYKSK